MKTFFTSLSLIFLFNILNAQDCPTQHVTVSSQQELDDFKIKYPDCKEMLYNIKVNGADIENLNGLSNLVKIQGVFTISSLLIKNFEGMEQLEEVNGLSVSESELILNFAGLQNLSRIGRNGFSMNENPSVQNFKGLESLIEIEGGIYFRESGFENFEGLNNLVSTGNNFEITSNPNFTSCKGLENFTTCGYVFNLYDNPQLISMEGLEKLSAISNALVLQRNEKLEDLSAFEALDSNQVKVVVITDNPNLEICNATGICQVLHSNQTNTDIKNNGSTCESKDDIMNSCHPSGSLKKCLDNGIKISNQTDIDLYISNHSECQEIIGSLTIDDTEIEQLDWLSNVQIINGDLSISNNSSLESMLGFENLTSVLGNIVIENNGQIKELSGFENLNYTNSLKIRNEPQIENFKGLTNLSIIQDRFYIESNDRLIDFSGMDSLVLSNQNLVTLVNNPLLSVCNAPFLCDYFNNPISNLEWNAIVANNQEGCNSINEILSNCNTSSVDSKQPLLQVTLYPNPTTGKINFGDNLSEAKITVTDLTGRILLAEKLFGSNEIDLPANAKGVLFMKIKTEDGVLIKRIIKE